MLRLKASTGKTEIILLFSKHSVCLLILIWFKTWGDQTLPTTYWWVDIGQSPPPVPICKLHLLKVQRVEINSLYLIQMSFGMQSYLDTRWPHPLFPSHHLFRLFNSVKRNSKQVSNPYSLSESIQPINPK